MRDLNGRLRALEARLTPPPDDGDGAKARLRAKLARLAEARLRAGGVVDDTITAAALAARLRARAAEIRAAEATR